MHRTFPKPEPYKRVKARRKRQQRKADRAVYQAVDERDGQCCVRCGRFGIHRHHKRFRSLGGKTTIENVESLCETCHRRAHRL